jgi:hypothetical protein
VGYISLVEEKETGITFDLFLISKSKVKFRVTRAIMTSALLQPRSVSAFLDHQR